MSTIAMDLTPDILREIFKYFSTPMVIHNPQLFPWFLGHICAEWRKTFLSMTVEFWNNLEIKLLAIRDHFPRSVAPFERALEILAFCLKCNEGSLSFSFYMCNTHQSEEYPDVIGMLDALIGQSARWLKAELHIWDTELQRLHHVKGRTPLLQSLALERLSYRPWSSAPIRPVDERFADTFSNSPNLTRLDLTISTWKFDWSSIITLHSSCQNDPKSLFTILPQATRLEELKLGRMYGNRAQNHDENQSLITLPFLKKLTIHDETMLRVLVTPALEWLALDVHDILVPEQNPDAIIAASSFIRRSSPPLKHLELWNATPELIAAVLPVVPASLIRLELYEYEPELLIQLLNCDPTSSTPPIAPQLKSLRISCLPMLYQGLIAELVEMVDSRAKNSKVEGLQELVVCPEHTIVVVDLTALQTKCEEQGVKLTVGNVLRP